MIEIPPPLNLEPEDELMDELRNALVTGIPTIRTPRLPSVV